MSMSIPLLKLFSLIIFFAIKKNGLNILSTFSTDSEIGIEFSPKDDLIEIFWLLFFSEIIVTRLLIAPKIALVP